MSITASPDVARNARPYLYGGEEAAIASALSAGQYNHGAVTEEFEQALAAFVGVPDVVAVASGTAALHVGLLAAGVGPGHEVVVPSFTFCATVQAILAAGARPRFVEVNPDTGCVEPAEVLGALTPDTRAVMPVLYGGRAIDLSPVRPALDEQGINVVEDAAQAFGSWQGERRVGATGVVTCFSFGPIKNLTCGLGGAIVPRTPLEADICRRLRGLGIVESAARRTEVTTYTINGFGMRVQMSPLNAAVGLVQLVHFAEAETRRRALWRAYAAALDGIDGVSLVDADVDRTVPALCAVRVLDGRRDRVFHTLLERGIGVGVHYPPNHTQPAFAAWHRPLPVTEHLGGQIMTLPFHQHLTEAAAEYITGELRAALAAETDR
ncbi:DegT/DnrJ/EryC1/StrS family aminotransferase [Streptomyces sp. Isolate_219]|uniref:DegT/DnrJ/EryC1/StrS family aminotransferase n=1 Tax=Streptomyces sp. Isolate_219 TaxID=2950110 RepID=UPI0021C8CF04|nr:DegT/DnrJ/EryC1/StrS family aminotransferase [Streptomyces sp. Isolate_219]MCR8577426.1 DegT/DnrJ/EryC1/StrS family aminotransferase [Streptomyces sp. Isolate_219]